jgi:anaerobic magnesium-protoporphyrin IX monomethyl ester cyclase
MAKVLLIQPNEDRRGGTLTENPSLPINLIYLATAIEDHHSVKIYDRNIILEDEPLLNLLREYNPDIVGMNSITSEMLLDLIYLGKLIKKEFPKMMILIGGVHATIEPESVLREPYVDYIIRGEGEAALLEFCDTFDKNPKNLKKLKNVNYNPLRPYVNMDDLKLPNCGLVDVKKYKTLYVNMSRGCPGNCSFCYSPTMWGIDGNPCIRSFSTEKSIALFKDLIEKYNIRVFSIVDDNFVPFKSRAIEICNFLSKYKVHFFCFGRADYVNDEILKALKKAGCHVIQIGLESGSQRVLNFLNKKTTVEQNIEAIRLCKKNKIKLDASLMIGIPTETVEEMNETVAMIKKYRPDEADMKIFNPMPGTPVFDYCVEKGFFKKPTTLEEWAGWTGDQFSVKHNTSEIPDDLLTKTLHEMWMVGFYKNKIKRFFYWMKVGEYKYALKSVKKLFFIRKDQIQIPGIGIKYRIKKKQETSSQVSSENKK